jgi:beta-phosphoglucomutase
LQERTYYKTFKLLLAARRTWVLLYGIAGIAFDLEGTLVDLEHHHFTAWMEAAAKVGLTLTLQEAVERLPHFVGGPDAAVAIEIATEAGDPNQADVVLDLKRQRLRHAVSAISSFQIREGALAVIGELAERKVPIAIGSATPLFLSELILTRSVLRNYFSPKTVVLQEMEKFPNKKAVYRETAARLRISPENQLVFEDSVPGVIAAKAAGSLVIALPTVFFPIYCEKLTAAGAIDVFASWHDFDLSSIFFRL